jgi:hypothetical protein
MDPSLATIVVALISLAGTAASLAVNIYLSSRVGVLHARVDGLLASREELTARAASAEGEMKGRDHVAST